jgi:hypothetical protein
MGGLVMAWLVGEGIIIYRSVKNQKAPPGPGQLLLSSGVFVLLGLLAESEKARPLAVTLAWGFDIAAFMNLFGTGTPKSSGGSWPPPQAAATIIIPDGKGTGSVSSKVQQGLDKVLPNIGKGTGTSD